MSTFQHRVLVDGVEYLAVTQGGLTSATRYLTIFDGNHQGHLVLCELTLWLHTEEVTSTAHGVVPRDIHDAWVEGRLPDVVRWAVATME